MNARISKMALIAFSVLLVLSFFLLSVAGEYWPWYAMMAALAVAPIVVGPRSYRLLGTVALTLSVVLIISDYAAGKRRRARHQTVSAMPMIWQGQDLDLPTYIRRGIPLN